MSTLTRIAERFAEGTPLEWFAFVVATFGIAAAIWWLARYRAALRDDADHEVADDLLANHVRELRDRGEVSPEEYRLLENRVNLRADESGSSMDRSAGETPRGPDAS